MEVIVEFDAATTAEEIDKVLEMYMKDYVVQSIDKENNKIIYILIKNPCKYPKQCGWC